MIPNQNKGRDFFEAPPHPELSGLKARISPIYQFWGEFTDIFDTKLVGVSAKKKSQLIFTSYDP